MKNINWFKRFSNLAVKHDIWWSVCADGSLDYITFVQTDLSLESPYIKVGTKAAYLWLLKQIKENGQ